MEHQKKSRSAGKTESKAGGSSESRRKTVKVSRGVPESANAGMKQMSRMLREAREEGDPELMQRAEDLHARQQNLGERERSLRERDESLRGRERDLLNRQSRMTGKGMGATDYTDETHIQNRR